MRRMGVFCAIVIAIGLLPSVGSAQANWPLAAVGRIGKPDALGCTATLIERDLVLTAAHCLRPNMKNNEDVVFVTGSYPGVPAETVPIADVALHPIYLLNTTDEFARVRFDLALVRLGSPIESPSISPLGFTEAPKEETSLFLASYRGGRGSRPRERLCTLFGIIREALAIGCDVNPGESGSPVLLKTDAGLEIVGVLSVRTRVREQPAGFAAVVVPRIEPVFDVLKAP